MHPVALVAAAAAVIAPFGVTATGPARPHLSEARIRRIAERAAAAAGDRRPTLIQHSDGTRHRANQVAGGGRVPGEAWSYLIALRGSFTLDVPTPSGAQPPSGTVLTLVVDARSGRVSDFGVSRRYPDLAALGTVTTDLRQASPGCAPQDPVDLPARVSSPARRQLAPLGAGSIELCRYAGANARPPLRLTRTRPLHGHAQIAGLTRQFDRLPRAPRGTFFCPLDDGSAIVAELGYPDGHTVPIRVGLEGCRIVTNGAVQRLASGYGTPPTAGPRLISRLERLLAGTGR